MMNSAHPEYCVSIVLGAQPNIPAFSAVVRFHLFRYPEDGPYCYRCASCSLSSGAALWQTRLWAKLDDQHALDHAVGEMHSHCLHHEAHGHWALQEYANSPKIPGTEEKATLERKLSLAEMSAAASSRALESSNQAALEIGRALGCSAVTSDIVDHIHELQRTISRLTAKVECTSPSICERSVKESFPFAHCVPLAHAVYPSFYVIRQDREEWSPELGTGRVPDEAWANAMIKIQNDKGARAAEATEIKP